MKNSTNHEAFYLGHEFDLSTHEVDAENPVHYETADLTTHGVVVGMTGSGKTGLGITLLEEAALKKIPSVILDLKGDLSNLLLTFPELKGENFTPWLDPDEARRQGCTIEELGDHRAKQWAEGIKNSNQDRKRLKQLQEGCDWRIYTPGSDAGIPVSVIQTFTAPPPGTDEETMNQRIESTTSAILSFTKITIDPIQSREHILIANLLQHAWTQGRDLDLEHLIGEVTEPSIRKIGTFDIDMFYPEEERMKLALALNNLLASPSFKSWLHGVPLNLGEMMFDEEGNPRQSIFYLAHLDDSQRMFFMTLLLEEMILWMRTQTGTSTLRALLYIDEMFGYLPPHPLNPSSKRPLMTLLKQARAFGVGMILATQNPVDIDYKALSNAGTWFVGKLQTDHDRARLIEGIENAAAEKGQLADKASIESAINGLTNRHFLMHDVHRAKPIAFRTRWTLSYLNGPMTRNQIEALMGPKKENLDLMRARRTARTCHECKALLPIQAKYCMNCGVHLDDEESLFAEGNAELEQAFDSETPLGHTPPVLPHDIDEFFFHPDPDTKPDHDDDKKLALVYEPHLLGYADVTISSKKPKLEHEQVYHLVAKPPTIVDPTPWFKAFLLSDEMHLEPDEEHPDALWAAVPEEINTTKKIDELEKEYVEFLMENAAQSVVANTSLDIVRAPWEDEERFKERCRNTANRKAKEQSQGKSAAEEAKASEKWSIKVNDIAEIEAAPKKSDIKVSHFGLAWIPFWWVKNGDVKRIPAIELERIADDVWGE